MSGRTFVALVLLVFLLHATAAPAQQVTPYGRATPGTGSIGPRAWVHDDPRVASGSFYLALDQGRGGAPALALFATARLDLQLPWLRLLVDPTAPGFTSLGPVPLGGAAGVPGAGAAALRLPIPNDASLWGQSFFTQWVVVDPGAALGLAASDGVHATLRGLRAFLGVQASGLETVVGTTLAQTPWSPGAESGGSIAVTRDGRIALAGTRSTTGSSNLRVYDVATVPAAFVWNVSVPSVSTVGDVAMHPVAPMAYVTVRTDMIDLVTLWTCDLQPGSPTFGLLRDRLVNDRVVQQPKFSADGRVMAVAHTDMGFRSEIVLMDVDPASPTRHTVLRRVPAYLAMAELAPDGSQLFVLGPLLGPPRLRVIDTQTGNELAAVSLAGAANRLTMDPRGRFLLAWVQGAPGFTSIDLATGSSYLTTRPIPTAGVVDDCALSADGASILVARGALYETYDLQSGTLLTQVAGSSAIQSVAWR